MKPITIFLSLISIILLSACTAVTPPRLATAQVTVTPITTGEPFISKAPTATPQSADAENVPTFNTEANPSLTIWINESSPEHAQLVQEMAVEFNELANIDAENGDGFRHFCYPIWSIRPYYRAHSPTSFSIHPNIVLGGSTKGS